MKKSIFTYISFIFISIGLSFSSGVFAAEISLYDQPSVGSKVVGSVDLSVGLIPIYTPKNSDWMKVGDPRNGNVGWVQAAAISKAMGGSSNAVTVTQKIMNDGKGQQSYQVMQFNQPTKPTESAAPITITIPNILPTPQQQQVTQQNIQKALDEAVKQFNAIYQQQIKALKDSGPLVSPNLFPAAQTPASKTTPPATNVKQ